MRRCDVSTCHRPAITRVRLPGGGAPELRDVCAEHRDQFLAGVGEATAWSPSSWTSSEGGVSHRSTVRGEALVVQVGRTWWPMIRMHRDRSPGFIVLEPQSTQKTARRAATMELQ